MKSGASRSTEKESKGRLWIVLGLVLIAAALCLAAYNLVSERSAGDRSEEVAASLKVEDVSLTGGSLISADTPMPTEIVDGDAYVGILRVPALGLELPVMSEWSYPGLRIAPCRYFGSVYSDDMVIAAHNYTTHFGRLGEMSYGDEVSFTDVRGNVFVYKVASMEKLGPYDVQEMTGSEYDLTLFTCTLGGSNRVTVRCEEVLL